MLVRFTGIPSVDLLTFHAGGLLGEAVGGEDLAVENDVGQAVLLGLQYCFVQVRGSLGEHGDDLVEVAVAGGAGDVVRAVTSPRPHWTSRSRSPPSRWPSRPCRTRWRALRPKSRAAPRSSQGRQPHPAGPDARRDPRADRRRRHPRARARDRGSARGRQRAADRGRRRHGPRGRVTGQNDGAATGHVTSTQLSPTPSVRGGSDASWGRTRPQHLADDHRRETPSSNRHRDEPPAPGTARRGHRRPAASPDPGDHTPLQPHRTRDS